MKRTLEKLASQREDIEAAFTKKYEELKKRSQDRVRFDSSSTLAQVLGQLKDLEEDSALPSEKSKKALFAGLFKTFKKARFQDRFNQQVFNALREVQRILEESQARTQGQIALLAEMIRLGADLATARDREWDALGSNHVGMIFKSMEWRVDNLAAQSEDANLLMKRFLHLKENLTRLLTVLEAGKSPSPQELKNIIHPLEDWRYAGFENRFRGSEEEVKKQQEVYLPFFQTEGTVLDCGCGRGEFVELLRDHGIAAEGIDINDQMIAICRDKGLVCRKADILETLAGRKDGSLGGLFSSQVIEHLSPSYLKRMIELAYFKLASGSSIVLETINPTSVFSLLQIYFLDISHQNPVHPGALQFLLESAGFEDVEIRYSPPLEEERLRDLPPGDEAAAILNENIDKLNTLLYAPPNYAAIARKR